MSKIVSIRENGELKQFTTSKIKTLLQNGEYAYWIPEDEIDVVEKIIVENGVYTASDEGHLGYSEVTVSVPTRAGSCVFHGTTVPLSIQGEDGDVYLLEEADVETPSWISALGYTCIKYVGIGEEGPYINLGGLDLDTRTISRFEIYMVFTQTPSSTMGIFGYTGTEADNVSISYNGTTSKERLECAADNAELTFRATETITSGSTTFAQYTSNDILRTSATVDNYALGSEDKYLFATNGIATKASYLHVHGLIVDCNGASHYFTPVMRDADGAIGFFDTYSRTFYTNIGTGSFISGGTGGGIIGAYYKENGSWTELFPDARGHYFGNGSGSSSGGSTSGSGSSESGSSESGSSETGNTSGSGSSESGTGSGSESGSSGTEESGQEAVTVDEILVYKDGTKYESLSYQNWPNESNTDRIFEDSDKLRFLIDSTSADAETGDYYRLWVWSTDKYDISNYTSAYIKYALNGTVYETTLDISSLRGSKNIAVHFWYKLAYDYEVDGVAYHTPEECSATFYIHEEDYTEAQSVETKLFDREDNSPSTFYIYEMRIDP